MTIKAYVAAFSVFAGAAPVAAVVETFDSEAAYLAALQSHGYTALVEDFEGGAWDPYRTTNPFDPQAAESVTSKGITWSGNAPVTTNQNWGRGGTWGIFTIYLPPGSADELIGQRAQPMYAVGGWFDSNPDFGADFEIELDGVLSADRAAGSGHVFLGVIDTDGFTTFRVYDAEQEAVFGADDFTFGIVPVAGDVNQDGEVNVVDLLELLGAWGTCAGCPEDLNDDGAVNVVDLLQLLGNWS